MSSEQADGRRHSLNTRTTKQLRDRLEAAATASGRSLAQEVEARLEKSFAEEDILLRVFGTPHDMLLLRTIAAALSQIQGTTGTLWSRDRETLRQCQMAVEQILFAIWGGSRRDHPRKSQAYIDKIDARLPEGVELAAIAVQYAMSEVGLAFPPDDDGEIGTPPPGMQIKMSTVASKGSSWDKSDK